jgi:hypothetical protein
MQGRDLPTDRDQGINCGAAVAGGELSKDASTHCTALHCTALCNGIVHDLCVNT